MKNRFKYTPTLPLRRRVALALTALSEIVDNASGSPRFTSGEFDSIKALQKEFAAFDHRQDARGRLGSSISYDMHPVSGETPNRVRASWAHHALTTFTRETYGGRTVSQLLADHKKQQADDAGGAACSSDLETAVYDLIADLLHFSKCKNLDCAALLQHGIEDFLEEQSLEGSPIIASPLIAAVRALKGNDSQDSGAALAVALGGISSMVTQLEVIARFILNGEDDGDGGVQAMTTEDAFESVDSAVAVARTVADQGRALLNRLGAMVQGAPVVEAAPCTVGAEVLRDLVVLGRERELAFKENDETLRVLCVRAAAALGPESVS